MEKQDKLHYICSIEYKTDSMTQDRCLCWAFYLFFKPSTTSGIHWCCVWCKSSTLCYSVLCRIVFHQCLVCTGSFILKNHLDFLWRLCVWLCALLICRFTQFPFKIHPVLFWTFENAAVLLTDIVLSKPD